MLKEILSGTFRMRYEFLTSTEHALFDAAFDLHELSFPPPLRRSRESFARAFSDPDFECIAFRESQAIMGYATRWFLPSAVYLESLVVAPESRGLGLGRQHLHEIVATSRKPVAALVAYALERGLIGKSDVTYASNGMFDILRYEPAGTFVPKRACARFTAAAACPSLEEILAALLDDAVSRGVIVFWKRVFLTSRSPPPFSAHRRGSY